MVKKPSCLTAFVLFTEKCPDRRVHIAWNLGCDRGALRGTSPARYFAFFGTYVVQGNGKNARPPSKSADEMDMVGGYLNAFTDKEYTCYYARMLAEHLPLGVDIFGGYVCPFAL